MFVGVVLAIAWSQRQKHVKKKYKSKKTNGPQHLYYNWNKKTKRKPRVTVDDIPTTTDLPRNHLRYRNRNQPNISPLSKNKKWCSVNKFFYGAWTTPSDLCDRLEPSFFGWSCLSERQHRHGRIPRSGRHFVFTIQLEKCHPNFFQVWRLGGACAAHANSPLVEKLKKRNSDWVEFMMAGA